MGLWYLSQPPSLLSPSDTFLQQKYIGCLWHARHCSGCWEYNSKQKSLPSWKLHSSRAQQYGSWTNSGPSPVLVNKKLNWNTAMHTHCPGLLQRWTDSEWGPEYLLTASVHRRLLTPELDFTLLVNENHWRCLSRGTTWRTVYFWWTGKNTALESQSHSLLTMGSDKVFNLSEKWDYEGKVPNTVNALSVKPPPARAQSRRTIRGGEIKLAIVFQGQKWHRV